MFSDISYIIYFHIGTDIFELKLYQFSNIWLNLFMLFAKVRPLFESSQTTTKMLLVHLKRVQSWAGLNGATNSKLQFQLFTKGQPVWSNNKKNCENDVCYFVQDSMQRRGSSLFVRLWPHVMLRNKLWHFISLFLSFFVDFNTIYFVSSKLFLCFCSLSTNF